jgi:hypothetical protein
VTCPPHRKPGEHREEEKNMYASHKDETILRYYSTTVSLSHSTCSALSSSPHAHSFVLGIVCVTGDRAGEVFLGGHEEGGD